MDVINWMESVVVVQIMAFWTWVWGFWETQFIIYHAILNFALALAASVYLKEFVLEKTFEVLWRKILPLVLVFAAFAAFGETLHLAGASVAVWAIIESKLLADMLENLGKLGVPWVKNIAPHTLRNGTVITGIVEEIHPPQRE